MYRLLLDGQVNARRYPVWASLARDHLAIMASSVSSERAFSSAGITISKRRNHLKGDIVEALQCLKCMIHKNLIFRFDPAKSIVDEIAEEDDLHTDVGDDILPNFTSRDEEPWSNIWQDLEEADDTEG
jgi:hAT family C-terminal dimerisation region